MWEMLDITIVADRDGFVTYLRQQAADATDRAKTAGNKDTKVRYQGIAEGLEQAVQAFGRWSETYPAPSDGPPPAPPRAAYHEPADVGG